MEQLPNAASGMGKAYKATRGSLICLLLMCVSSLRIYVALGILAFLVLHIVGLCEAGKDIEGCRKAFFLSVVSVIMIILAVIPIRIISVPALLARCGTEFLTVYLVCVSVSEKTDQLGAVEVRREGETAWRVNAVCNGLVAFCALLEGILDAGAMQGLAVIAAMLLPLLGKVFYMIFLKSCSQALDRW